MIAAMSTVRLWRMPTPSANWPASSRSRAGLRRVGSIKCLLSVVSYRIDGASNGRGDRLILDRLGGRKPGHGKPEPTGAAETAPDRRADNRGFRDCRRADAR